MTRSASMELPCRQLRKTERPPTIVGSLARLAALQGRYDEAAEWFAKSRAVLEEDGIRPLRAVVDYDEALMHARRNAHGRHRARAPASRRGGRPVPRRRHDRLGQACRDALDLIASELAGGPIAPPR
jgi:hypothetical protein